MGLDFYQATMDALAFMNLVVFVFGSLILASCIENDWRQKRLADEERDWHEHMLKRFGNL